MSFSLELYDTHVISIFAILKLRTRCSETIETIYPLAILYKNRQEQVTGICCDIPEFLKKCPIEINEYLIIC